MFSFPFSPSHFSLVCFHLDSKSSFCCSHYKWRSSENTGLPYEEIITEAFKITSTWHEYQMLEICIGCKCWTCYIRLNSPVYLVTVGTNKTHYLSDPPDRKYLSELSLCRHKQTSDGMLALLIAITHIYWSHITA